MKKVLSLIAAAILLVSASNSVNAISPYNIKRIFGEDRYKTSVNISNNFSNSLLNSVVVASGKDFPDALSGSVLSKKFSAPILLLGNTIEESSDSIEYIKNHLDKKGKIYLLGGQASLGDEFIGYFNTLGYNDVIRLGGKSRFETNKAIVNYMDVKKGTPVILTNGYGFADALSVSSAAALNQYPIIMTDPSKLPEEAADTISNLQPEQLYIIGGQASIKDSVVNEVKNLVPTLKDNQLIRISGNDRYETTLNICKYFNLDTDTAIIANGSNFPDALSGSALAAKLKAPIILTDGLDISNQKSFIESKGYQNLILLGGLASIDLSVEYSLRGANNMTQKEKQYFKDLSAYCETFRNKSSSASNYIDETFIKSSSLKTISQLTTSAEISETIDSLIQIYKDGKSSLEKYKEDLNTIKTKSSNLQSPSGLESFKNDYIQGVEEELIAVDKLIDYYTKYIDLFTSLKESFNGLDAAKVNEKLNELEITNKTFRENLGNLQKGEIAIKALSERLLKIEELIK